MSKIQRYFSVVVLIFFLALPAWAESISPQKNLAITQAFDCLQNRTDSNIQSNWNNVCYNGNTGRDAVIDQSLDNMQLFIDDTEKPSKAKQPKKTPDKSASQPQNSDDKPSLERKNLLGLEIKPYVSYIIYHEPNYMKSQGAMYGISTRYTHRMSENGHIHSLKDIFQDENKVNMFKLEGDFGFGYMDYESEGTGTMDDILDYLLDLRAMGGYDIPLKSSLRLTPYFGIGYRYLRDNTGGRTTTTNHYGYDRESRYIYLPTGIETFWALKNSWSAQLNLEFDFFVSGEQKSHLEDVNPSFGTLKNTQNHGHGMRGSFALINNGPDIDFLFEPFVRYWSVMESDIAPIIYAGTIVSGGVEPKNNSTEYGVKFGMRF